MLVHLRGTGVRPSRPVRPSSKYKELLWQVYSRQGGANGFGSWVALNALYRRVTCLQKSPAARSPSRHAFTPPRRPPHRSH